MILEHTFEASAHHKNCKRLHILKNRATNLWISCFCITLSLSLSVITDSTIDNEAIMDSGIASENTQADDGSMGSSFEHDEQTQISGLIRGVLTSEHFILKSGSRALSCLTSSRWRSSSTSCRSSCGCSSRCDLGVG